MKKMSLLILFLSGLLIQLHAQQSKDEMLLEAIGALSGQNMYLTYLSLGNVADSFASGVYKQEFAAELADELSEMIKMTIQQYNSMLESNKIYDDDYNALLKFVDVYNALLEEALGLKAMIVVGNEENIGRFERGRNKAWQLISEMLGITEQG